MYNDALKKNLAYLKSFVKWAKKKHYTVCEEFDSYKPKILLFKGKTRSTGRYSSFIIFIDIRNRDPTVFMQGASLQSQR